MVGFGRFWLLFVTVLDGFGKFGFVFGKFLLVLVSFLKFLDLPGPVWTCSDPFGCIRMHLDAFGCVRTLSENYENFRRKNWFCLRERYWPVPEGAQTFIYPSCTPHVGGVTPISFLILNGKEKPFRKVL